MMKKSDIIKCVLLCVLAILPIIAAAAVLPSLPDTVPVHFGIDGTPDRIGSRYELLAICALPLEITAVIMILIFIERKRDSGKNNTRGLIVTGLSAAAVFDAMLIYYLHSLVSGSSMSLDSDFARIASGLFGIMIFSIGNIMPTLRRNSIIGFRTMSSRKNDYVWGKTQHFCGILYMIAGALTTAIAIFLGGSAGMKAMLILTLTATAAGMAYSYNLANNSPDTEEEFNNE